MLLTLKAPGGQCRDNQAKATIRTTMTNINKPVISQVTVIDLVPFGQRREEGNQYALRLSNPEWSDWKPGQFVMIRKPGADVSPLLARPLSICRVSPTGLILFFQEVGRMTTQLAKVQPGDIFDIWGPLGNSFAVEPQTPTLLLAGGIGVAPFVGYVEEHPAAWNVSMEFGHRLPVDCYPLQSLNQKIAVESFHEQTPADLPKFIAHLENRMARHAEEVADPSNKSGKGLVLACGPTPFLRTVQQLAKKYTLRTQISLENRMACGIGACLGCVAKRAPKEGAPDAVLQGPAFVQSCTHGPCFWSEDIVI